MILKTPFWGSVEKGKVNYGSGMGRLFQKEIRELQEQQGKWI